MQIEAGRRKRHQATGLPTQPGFPGVGSAPTAPNHLPTIWRRRSVTFCFKVFFQQAFGTRAMASERLAWPGVAFTATRLRMVAESRPEFRSGPPFERP